MEHLFRKVDPSSATDLRSPRPLKLSQVLNWPWHRIGALLLSDILALAIAWRIAAHFNQFYSPIPAPLVWWHWLGLPSLFWVFATIALLVLAEAGLYSSRTQWKNYLEAGKLVSFVYLFSLVVSYFYDPKLDAPRSLFFTAWFGSVALVIGFRLVTTLILRQFEQTQPPIPVFLIAPADRLPRLASIVKRRSHYNVVGAALSSTANSSSTLQSVIASQAQEVIAERLPESELASGLYWQLQRRGVTLRLLPSSREMLHRRGLPEVFAGLPTLRIAEPLSRGMEYRLKRWLDVIGAFLGVVGLSPLFLGIAIAIKLTSPGPVFFRQERMGLNHQIFQVWKFRTMALNAPQLQAQLESQNQANGVMFKLKHDPRVTPLGRFLRRTSLDELPQLLNVLMGQMSLVGPRPLPLRDIERFQSWHHIRHHVLPGITGLWQVSGRSDLDDFDDVARLDLHYIDNWSLNLDLEILVETVRIVLFGRGAY